ncbi:MAG: C25 family cysteine peptidase [Bacteroidota bacterium]
MKRILLFLCFLVAAFQVRAQSYGNEWISFVNGQPYSSQQYFRIGVWKNGVYRLAYNDLQNASVPVNAWFSPDRYQLFHRGKEQFIRVLDNDQNGIFNNGDYIEFVGNKNDGVFDGQMYDTLPSQPNPYQSLFNDTAAYFLTYNFNSTNNRRMKIENDQNFTAYPTASLLKVEEVKTAAQEYNIGDRDANSIADNSYTQGEGFYFYKVGFNQNVNVDFTINKSNSSVNAPELEMVQMGANALAHPYNIIVNGNTINSNTIWGYALNKDIIPISLFPVNGNVNVKLQPLADVSNPYNVNYMNLGYVKIKYDRTTDFSGETFPANFYLEQNNSKYLVNFTSVTTPNPLLYVIDNDTVHAIVINNNNGNFNALIPAYNGKSAICLLDNNQVFYSNGNVTIESVNRDLNPNAYARFNNYKLNGATADFLIVSNRNLWTGAQAYANYRATKGHTPLLVDVNELYDQFAWGIRQHPQAIRSFSDFMIDNAVGYPKYLLLLGKGIMITDARSGLGHTLNYVPTWGEPASDQLFTAKLNTNSFVPELATGRIAATNNDDITAYLNKLIEFESNQSQAPALWMKNVLHFGGGNDLNEQNVLAAKLNAYAQIIQDTLFGGKVYTFLKNSSAPIQINQSQYLQSLIDSGSTMMTFYGHAAGTSFDISTDAPENYNNKGKYPLVLAQSCYVGDIFTTSKLLNERFVLTPDKAAIGFVAVPDKGIIEELDAYSTELHQQLFRLNYGKSVSTCMSKTINTLVNANPGYKNVCMSMTMHGDPAINLNAFELPDYSIDNASILFEPGVVTTELDSFVVKVAIKNLGKNTSETMRVQISRRMPDGVSKRDTIVLAPYITYCDTIQVKLPVDFRDGAGLNTFDVTVDAFNEVQEINESSNNFATATLQITSTDINPVFPSEFAIVPKDSVTLKATTANLFANPKNYIFELDTSAVFSSSVKLVHVVSNVFGVVSWSVPLTLVNNQVYYWRVANDSILNPDTAISNRFQWKYSSFMYKQGITGWSQADYPQFQKDELTNVIRQNAIRYFEFINSQYALTLTHSGTRPSYEINGINIDYGGCNYAPQIAVAVLDSIDFEHPWQTDSCIRYFGNYNYYNCATHIGCNRLRPDKFFLFNTAIPAQTDSLVDMILNDVPNGDYILSWTVFDVPFDTLSVLKNGFAALGSLQYSSLTSQDKYIFFMKKGDPSTELFQKGTYPTSDLRIGYTLQRDWDKGYYTSTKIGPASSWSSVHWDFTSMEAGLSPDSVALSVIGINAVGQEFQLMNGIFQTTKDFSIANIDAATYPYLKLKLYAQDGVNRTPPQLTKWQVYYDPVPEGTINPSYYTFNADTVQEGQTVNLKLAFENISTVEMDSLLVDYYLFNQQNVRYDLATVRLPRNLPAGDTIMTGISLNTRGFVGNNTLWVEVNPRNDQPEQYHFNNLASIRFNVSRDITNPLLDVTFDGAHILNGDIISAKPTVNIQLLDENKFIALNDTANFRVSITDPDGLVRFVPFEMASSSNSEQQLLQWIPANLPKNSFNIIYQPTLLKDGIYTLSVQATDESGNQSGLNDYKIQFEVINKSTITEVINYPNPFSTSTRFVFTLTGSEIPDDFRIRIMTVSGKIVREISRAEIGDIHIGRNITDFAWDGKDQFGDQLANGVYLYKVITGMNGNEIEKRETIADQYFKKGWGKMYLMR